VDETPPADQAAPEERPAGGPVARFLDAAFSGEEDPTALGVLRAALVAVLLLSLSTHLGHVREWFSSEAPVHGRFARELFPSRFSLFFEHDDPTFVVLVFAIGTVAHVCWMLGLFTRLSSILSVFLWINLNGRVPLLYAYPDQLSMMVAFLLATMPAGRGFSLDARWLGRGGPVPVWCRRVIQLQVAVVYTVTGMLKDGETWTEGTALYYTLVNPHNRHFDLGPTLARLQPWVLRPATLLALLWEVAFAGFVLVHWGREMARDLAPEARWRRFIPDLRWAFLGFGVAMHLTIQVMLYVVHFSALMMATYLAFLSTEEMRALATRLDPRRLVARGRGASAEMVSPDPAGEDPGASTDAAAAPAR